MKDAVASVAVYCKFARPRPKNVHAFRDKQFAAGERDFGRRRQGEVNRVAVAGAGEGVAQGARAAVGSVGDGNRCRTQRGGGHRQREQGEEGDRGLAGDFF